MKIKNSLFVCLILFSKIAFAEVDKNLHVALRQIGHRLLQSSGDSTSRVLPIDGKGQNTYILSFDKAIHVTSDSLYDIASYELGRIGIRDFIAELKGCGSEEIVLSFLYSQSIDSMTPCRGRNLPSGCYILEVTILKPKQEYWYFLLVPFLFAIILVYKNRKYSSQTIEEPSAKELLLLGNYQFDYQNRQLIHPTQNESLTEKEARLLSLLLQGINEIQSREHLMNELWAESGIMVVSKNLDVLVSKLRKKLSLDENIRIVSVHGIGYKLETE